VRYSPAVAEPQILAMGGAPLDPLSRLLLELTGKRDPRVCWLGQATGEAPETLVRFYELFPSDRCRPSHVRLFGIPRPGWRAHLLAQDAIFVGGGNTANMLAVWRVHGVDRALREAWEAGIVLGGVSAGAICWFEAGVTDSFRAELDGIACLGFLAGSACPHYDGEEERRPAYHRLVGGGFPAGYAADDGVGLRFAGTELAEAVTAREGAAAYRVELLAGEVRETPLETRSLG
jgi:dipeptidase E